MGRAEKRQSDDVMRLMAVAAFAIHGMRQLGKSVLTLAHVTNSNHFIIKGKRVH